MPVRYRDSQYQCKRCIRNIYSLSIAAITEKYFIINANRQKGESRYLLINRSNHQTTVYDRTLNEDMNFGRFIANDKGLVIQLVNYFDLLDETGVIKNTPLVNKIKQQVRIEENMNPVLMIYDEK